MRYFINIINVVFFDGICRVDGGGSFFGGYGICRFWGWFSKLNFFVCKTRVRVLGIKAGERVVEVFYYLDNIEFLSK